MIATHSLCEWRVSEGASALLDTLESGADRAPIFFEPRTVFVIPHASARLRCREKIKHEISGREV